MNKKFEYVDDNPGSYFGMLVESVEDKKELTEDKFVPQDKMSKKVKKELNDKKRRTWGNTKPVTRVKPNNKAYDRKRDKKIEDESLSLQESKNKIYKIWFSDLDQVDDDYNKLDEKKFKVLLKKLMGSNCRLDSYTYKNTNGYAEAIFKSNSLKDLYNGALRVLGDSDDVIWKLAEDNDMSEEEIYSLLDINESLEESKLNESHNGWEFIKYDGVGPVESDAYYKYVGDDIQLVIYPPQTFAGDTYDTWEAEIYTDNGSSYQSVDDTRDGFDSFEEAEAWINNKLKNLGESLKESKLNESSDGWDEGKLSDLSYILDKLANLQYEINNCVKGAYSHCTSYSELGEYIKDLGSELMDIADDVSEYVEEDDEEDED